MKLGTISAVITLCFTSTTAALAQTSIQGLPNGNHRFCSNPPPSSVVSDEEFAAAGYCFVFRKTGNRIIGDFFDMSTFGEEGVCATGTLNGNTVTGEALESLLPENEPLPIDPGFQGSNLVNWDDNGYLKVARANATHDQYEEYVITSIRYRTAILNLDGFHRYNAGTQPPPTSCQN